MQENNTFVSGEEWIFPKTEMEKKLNKIVFEQEKKIYYLEGEKIRLSKDLKKLNCTLKAMEDFILDKDEDASLKNIFFLIVFSLSLFLHPFLFRTYCDFQSY